MTDWQVVRLEDAAEIVSGITLGRKTRAIDLVAVPYLRVANVQDGRLDLREIKFVNASPAEIKELSLRDGDLLLTEGGDLDKLGRGACWRTQIPLCIHQNHIFRVRLPKASYDPDFVSFQVGSPYGKAYFLAHAKKTTGIASINRRVLGGFPLLTPPLSRQRKLVERLKVQLAEVEAARQAAKAQLGDVSRLPNRIINDVFNEITGEPTTLDEFLVDIQAGKSFQTAETLAGPDELGVLKVSAVTWTDFRPNEAKALMDVYDPAESHKVKNGDFIISRANTKEFVGAVVLVDRDYPNRLLSDKTLRLVVDERRVSKEFLLFALRTSMARRHIEHYATGTSDSMRNISQGTITSIPLCLPELNEQKRLATQLKERLNEVNEVRSAIELQMQELKTLPNRILAQTFES